VRFVKRGPMGTQGNIEWKQEKNYIKFEGDFELA
jgi:hypothetical protein